MTQLVFSQLGQYLARLPDQRFKKTLLHLALVARGHLFLQTLIKQYKKNNTATVLGYDPILKVQIKLQGTIESHYHNSVTRNAWDGSTTRSKKCYSVKGGSSFKIDSPSEYDLKDGNIEDGYKNFAVLIFTFDSLEYLHLKSSGHRRALHTWNDNYASQWLVP